MIFDKMFSSKVDNISAKDAEKLLRKKNVQFLDVRRSQEYNAGHIPQTIHIPLSELESNLDKLDQKKEVIVVCASGMRSSKAARKLDGLGYQVKNLKGGMNSWQGAVE